MSTRRESPRRQRNGEPRRRDEASPRRHRSREPRHRSKEPRHHDDRDPTSYDARSRITQSKVDKARARRRESPSSSDSDEEDCGTLCFSREIRETKMPKKFKLTTEVQKYDGSQDPKTWLKDYLTTVKCQKGSKMTAMQYLNLLLTGSKIGRAHV